MLSAPGKETSLPASLFDKDVIYNPRFWYYRYFFTFFVLFYRILFCLLIVHRLLFLIIIARERKRLLSLFLESSTSVASFCQLSEDNNNGPVPLRITAFSNKPTSPVAAESLQLISNFCCWIDSFYLCITCSDYGCVSSRGLLTEAVLLFIDGNREMISRRGKDQTDSLRNSSTTTTTRFDNQSPLIT